MDLRVVRQIATGMGLGDRWRALVAGWSEAAGWAELPAWSRRWALRYTLDDLTGRHTPAELAPLTRALNELEDAG